VSGRPAVTARTGHALSPREVAVVRQLAGLALGYPDSDLLARLPLMRMAVSTLRASVGSSLAGLLDHLARTPPEVLTTDYVATFDLSRRHALHLTYFTHGDTRKRGLALLRIKQTYRRFGYLLDDSGDDAELPDHLAVVLEFAATVDAGAGTRLLLEHRAGLELLGLALAEAGSPYAAATSAVSATLPALHGTVREAIVRLAAEGPPGEEVGLDPFVPPEVSGARR
jgi:nitrate reductase molybdenum cofactor assembly chaperone NarJ/NarW